MTINESRRQKQLARKKKKRKAKKALVNTTPGGTGNALRLAKNSAVLPVHECLVPEELFDGNNGIGTVIISRQMKNGDLAVGLILLDVYCLGVKNAFFRIVSLMEYDELLGSVAMNETLEPISPSCARKLVEECIAYARNLGFEPHPDYGVTRYIFGDIEAGSCEESYEFGKDGKPYYVSGPHDNPAKIAKILKTLRENCGEGNFHYLTEVSGF